MEAARDVDGLLLRVTDATYPAANESFLGFRVGDWRFLLPVRVHCEIIERPQVSPIPCVEPWFSGLLNIRGHIVPVVDLRLLPGEAAAAHEKRYLFAIDRGEKTMALWIDGYPQLVSDFDKSLSPPSALPEHLQRCVAKVYARDGQAWFKVDFEPFFKTLGYQPLTRETTS